jgi:retinol dehydrogenase-12
LVNNAGVGGTTGLTEDGFEIHFGVNHLGHFMLTHQLRPTFRPGTRIVAVSSEAHRRVDDIDFGKVREKGSIFTSLGAYAASKLANILFARRLAQLQSDWNTYSLHPGLADTNIFPTIAKLVFRNRKPPGEAARTSVYCATSPDVAGESGLYYSRLATREPSPTARDDSLARELWERSERWCGVAAER